MPRRRSPYHAKYLEFGAELVDRIGYDAPLRFTTTEEEHFATRQAAGLYDVYHQGKVEIKGKQAEALLQKACVNDLTRIGDGEVLYSSMCNEQGGMIDDLTIYRVSGDSFFLSPTPSRVDAVVAHLSGLAQGFDAYVTDAVAGTGFISVQGPRAREIVGQLSDADLSSAALPYYTFTRATWAEVPGVIARTGYSGEVGYEFFYSVEYANHVWEATFATGREEGLLPCGLGALRSIRIEKKYPLYGLDLNETTSPIEAGLGWTVRFEKDDFIGRDALRRQKEIGAERKLVAIEFDGLEFLPLPGDNISIEGEKVGGVTSADRGFFVGRSIAMGYVQPAVAKGDLLVEVTDKDGTTRTGTISLKAAYDPEREIVRA
jgi:aminomethyltransferase